MKAKRQVQRQLKQDYRRYKRRIAGILGDYSGTVDVPNRVGYVFVRLRNQEVKEAFNKRVPSLVDLPVWVGYSDDPGEPQILQVLDTRTGVERQKGEEPIGLFIPAHHETHEWFNPLGGQDVVFSDKRQFMPFRPTPIGGMLLHVYRNVGWLNGEYTYFSGSSIDLSPYVPNTGAYFGLVYEDTDATLSFSTGTGDFLKNAFTLTLADIPNPTPGTYPIAAVRMWGGMTGIVEALDRTDLIDLRFPFTQNFLLLSDVPWSYTGSASQLVSVKSDETGLEFVSSAGITGSSPSTFLGLTDTPSSYSGQATRHVRVNSGATALEFVTGTMMQGDSAGGDLTGTYPNPTVYALQGNQIQSGTPSNNQILIWNNSDNRWEFGDQSGSGGGSGALPIYDNNVFEVTGTAIVFNSMLDVSITGSFAYIENGLNWFSVRDYGAVGDGSTDDSAAIQATINAADDVGGVVYFPPGKYRLVTGVTLNTFTTMQGVSYHPQHHTSSPSTDYHFGSWIYVEDTTNPAITAKSGTGIQGLAFFYPNQAAGSSPPTTYPATIKLHDNGASLTTRVTIRDCFFQNPFYAINAEAAHEMLTVENCQGYPLSVGISIDQNSDIDRIDKVHFNPNCWREGETNSTTIAWVNANGAAFRVKKADWVRITNCFAYGYWIGLYLLDSVSGHTNDLIVSESGFDNCENCIYVTGAAEGIKIVDCDIVAENLNTTTGNHGITLLNTGEALVSECRIWGTSGHGIYIHGPSFVNITDNLIMEFGLNSSASNTYYGIIIDSNGVDRALIKGNEINGNSRNFIVGILLVGSANITNVEITHNHVHNMTLSGIYLNAGPTNIICRDNNLQSTGGLTNSLGAIVKDVRNNIVGSTLTSGPRARAYHNASQNVNNVTITALALNSERVDTDGIHDTATNNSRLTCRTPGSYLIIGNFRFAENATGIDRLGIIRLNGATEIARDLVSPAEATQHQVNPTTIYELALGDYVELCAYQDSGGALAVQTVAQYTPEFMMQRLG